jgi:hypothetical protein
MWELVMQRKTRVCFPGRLAGLFVVACSLGVGTAVIVGCLTVNQPAADRPEKAGYPPLLRGAQEGDADRVERLLANGANPNERSARGESALYLALRSTWPKDRQPEATRVVKALLDAGADPVAPAMTAFGGLTVLDFPIGTTTNAAVTLVRQRAQAELAALQARQATAQSPRGSAAAKPGLLLGSDADSLAPYIDPLVIRLRLARDADANEKDSSGNSLVHAAVQWKRLDLLQPLLDARANVNLRDREGRTPLHLACTSDFVDAARMLLARGADPYLADASGNAPADLRPDGAATRVLGQQVLAVAGDDRRWRFTAPGVEVRLRRERTAWRADHAPALRLDLWNHWAARYTVSPHPAAATLTVDGHRYTWAGPAGQPHPEPFVGSAASSYQARFNDIRLVLAADDWHNAETGLPLALPAGRHTVSVSLAANGANAARVEFATSPVSFDVAAD